MRLIEALKIQADCERDSEMKKLSAEKKQRLASLVEERVPSGLAPIEDWNEAIFCFSDDTLPETDVKKAKAKLLALIRCDECK